MINIAFVDCETTHLDAEIGEAWEVAVILRRQDGTHTIDTEYVWQFAIDRTVADPEALRIGRFRERHLVDPEWGAAFTGSGPIMPLSRTSAIDAIVHVLRGAVLVGSNPGFDDRFLRKLLGPGSAQWHYRPYDIVQLAAAKIGAQAAGPLPWRAHVLSRAVGVEPPTEEAAHTALGDARWARDVYDAATAWQPFEPTPEDRARHAIGLYTKTAIELEDARRDLATSLAATARAEELATELRAALAGPSPSPLPAGFRAEVVVAVKCAVCQYQFDVDDSHTVLFANVEQAHEVLRDHGWTVLTDGSAICDDEGDEHQALRQPGDAPSTPVNPDQTALDVLDDDGEEDGDSDSDVFELISEIAGRLSDATDEGEYHAVGLIGDLAEGLTTVAEARTALAEITFRHV
ncbi:hypothetical protein RM704_10445 [Streptomyces sp. DSM 3412]|uniref:Exonuclease domain-containing protein n=1 Tax=Streptomyces gottesmaniae TaxID=3075518 RepID=A0ABU2YU76_9ACTN|nr:hypothetical protein [Streptomyces sp. DSM 3412]MDT0567883.1 hypothetical protein [Streptomyces sp. DSM 3412]